MSGAASPLTAADFGLEAPLTPYQAQALITLLSMGAIGPAFGEERQAMHLAPSAWAALGSLQRLGLVARRDVAAHADPKAWNVRPGDHKRALWWLEPKGAAIAVELKRVGLAHWLEQGDGLVSLEAAA